MRLTQYYTATTLDGFIADPDDSLDWLFTRNQDRNGPLNYAEFVASVGALAMGSTTYQWILDHRPADKDPAEWRWPYEQPCWIFTHRELPVVSRSADPTRHSLRAKSPFSATLTDIDLGRLAQLWVLAVSSSGGTLQVG